MSISIADNEVEQLDVIDRTFLLLLTRGATSSYEVWNDISKYPQLEIKPIAYNNVNRRLLILHKKGYLEEIEHKDKVNIHGRKDYKLTMKGLEQVIPHLLRHPKEVENIVKYMDEFNLDTETFSHLLFSKLDPMKKLVSKYESLTTADYAKESDSDWLSGKDLEQSETSFGIFSKNRQKALVDDLLNQIKEGLMEFDPDTLTLVRTKKGRKFINVPMIKLTPSLLADLHLAPTTMQLQKNWEAEEEEFKHEEKLQSKMSHSKRKK